MNTRVEGLVPSEPMNTRVEGAVRLVQVAVPVPQLDALSYSIPDEFPEPVAGARVLVPLGKRVLTGIVLGTPPSLFAVRDSQFGKNQEEPRSAKSEPRAANRDSIKPIIDILDHAPLLPPDVLALTAWVAEYYACGIGEAIATAMPPRSWVESERHARLTDLGRARMLTERGARRAVLELLDDGRPARVDAIVKKGKSHGALLDLQRDGLVEITQPLKGRAAAHRTVRVAALTPQGFDTDASVRLGVRQQEALALLHGAPQGLDTSELAARGIAAPTLDRLRVLGLVTISRRTVERDPFEQAAAPAESRVPFVFTDEQQAAYERLSALASQRAFRTVLLHGVTGSGKTELYLRLAALVQRSGRGVLMLVPEIALTPAIAAIFRSTFGERVAIQHSGLSDGERHDQWHRIRRGEVDVVVGTRSAIFAPIQSLGLIVVDEEHDGSYKQDESPRYHGRDLAVVRGSQAAALVVLGSATPSMESFHNAQNGRYDLVTLRRRVLERPMASVQIVDMRQEYAANGPDVILSQPLCDAMALRFERREQSIVLLNRRGFATNVFCRQCAATLDCPNCSVSLTVHKAQGRARCHYCNYSIRLPKSCLNCAGPYLEQLGFGTERVEAEIRDRFPSVRVSRVDRDTVRRKGAIARLLAQFAAGDIDVLVGTQMIAKGHDFPRVTLVGVISADVGLGLADFRAGERTFQLLTQVAGRAGRGERAGEAIVQALYPEHYSIQFACRQDYPAFFERELNYRRGMRYPPLVALINAIVRGRTLDEAMQLATDIVRRLEPSTAVAGITILGPAPAPLARLRGEHRVQFFLKGQRRAEMRNALKTVLESMPEVRRRITVDVDPFSVM